MVGGGGFGGGGGAGGGIGGGLDPLTTYYLQFLLFSHDRISVDCDRCR